MVMDGFTLEESRDKVETLLGCQIEPGLKWHKQVDELLGKLRKRLTGLAHLRNIIPYNLRKTITEGMFTSVLAYCLPVFGGCDKDELLSLQVMQNKAARLVTHFPLRAPRKEMTYVFIFLIGCSFGELENLGIKALPGGQSCHQVMRYL